MLPPIAYVVAAGLVLLFAGFVVALRRLDRKQKQSCRELAQDLTDKVHDRCDAYRRLETRISDLISEYDHREAELRGERVVPQAAVATGFGEELDLEPTELSEAARRENDRSEVEPCEAACRSLSGGRSRAGGHEGSSCTGSRVESALEEITRRFHDLRSDERLERRRLGGGALGGIPGAAAGFAPLAAAWSEDPATGLGALRDRMDRIDRQILAWHAHYANLTLQRTATIETVHDLAAAILHASPATRAAIAPLVVTADGAASRAAADAWKRSPTPSVGDAATRARIAELESRIAEKERQVDGLHDSYRQVVDQNQRMTGELAERARRIERVQSQIDALQGDLTAAGRLLDNNKTQLSQLMRTMEVTKEEVSSGGHAPHDPASPYSAAYSLLHRLGPLVQALEGSQATAPRTGGPA